MIARRDVGVRPLRMALPKGSLYADSVALLARAGLDVTPIEDPGRQLLVQAGNMEYVIAKPTDIPAYLAYGGVDVAIAGKDVLLEAGLDVVEMADLRFGACRFVVAEPTDTERSVAEIYDHLGVVRIATKYPRIAEAYFASEGIQVEIVKLSGNIELAPLIGLAEQIVDITATGRTLAENGLRVVAEVLASTARFAANPVSLVTDTDRVSGLAEVLTAAATTGQEG